MTKKKINWFENFNPVWKIETGLKKINQKRIKPQHIHVDTYIHGIQVTCNCDNNYLISGPTAICRWITGNPQKILNSHQGYFKGWSSFYISIRQGEPLLHNLWDTLTLKYEDLTDWFDNVTYMYTVISIFSGFYEHKETPLLMELSCWIY